MPSFFGTTLTDLQGGRQAADKLYADQEMQRAQNYFELQRQANQLSSQRQQADQDRAMKFFEMSQNRDLEGRKLTNTENMTQAQIEQARRAGDITSAHAGDQLESEKIRTQGLKDIAEIQAKAAQGKLDPRVADEMIKQHSAIQDNNNRASAAASRANQAFQAKKSQVKQDFPTADNWYDVARPWRWNNVDEGNVALGQATSQIFSGLGPDADLVKFNPQKEIFEPVLMTPPTIPGGMGGGSFFGNPGAGVVAPGVANPPVGVPSVAPNVIVTPGGVRVIRQQPAVPVVPVAVPSAAPPNNGASFFNLPRFNPAAVQYMGAP